MKNKKFFSGNNSHKKEKVVPMNFAARQSGLIVPNEYVMEPCKLEFIFIQGQRILAHHKGRFFVLDCIGEPLTDEIIKDLESNFMLNLPNDAPGLEKLPVVPVNKGMPAMFFPVVPLKLSKNEEENEPEEEESPLIIS